MTEISRPWSGIVTGDAGPYSDDQWTDVWKTLLAHVEASQGVFRDQLGELDLSSITPSPISIAAGRALVNGIWYESDAAETIAIPTPGANPRIDRIVLRADWTLQTVRLFRIAGAEAASPVPPALVQNDGVTWDLPLWQVRITTGGVITFNRDEREFIGQYVPSEVSATHTYLREDWYLPGPLTLSNGSVINSFVVLEDGSRGAVDETILAGFGSGGISFSHNGTGTGGEAGVVSISYKPDIINARLRVRLRNPNTDAVLDRFIGFGNVSGDITPVDGVFFRADGNGGVTNWEAVCRAGGVETPFDTGQAVDDVWRVFEIRQHGTDVVTFLIDGVVVATIQSDIPSDVNLDLVQQILDDGVGTPASDFYMFLDYTQLDGDRS